MWKKVNFLQPAALRSSKDHTAHSFIQSAVEGTLWTDSMKLKPGLSKIPVSHSCLCTCVLQLCDLPTQTSILCVDSVSPQSLQLPVYLIFPEPFHSPHVCFFHTCKQESPVRDILLTLLKLTKTVSPQIVFERLLRSIIPCAESRENQLTY